jgi:hypothetical protein
MVVVVGYSERITPSTMVDHVVSIGVVLGQADSNGDSVSHIVLPATGMTSETTVQYKNSGCRSGVSRTMLRRPAG